MILLTIFCFLFGLLLLTFLTIIFIYKDSILPVDQAPQTKYAMVLGAGLEKNGKPSDILMDRILTGVNLYKEGKVEYLIMSGSFRKNYDEPDSMRGAAIDMGLPEQAILLDRDGFSTLDSCITIKEKFSPEQILIVSQFFHLPRAIMLQTFLGIKAIGIQARTYHFSLHKKVYWYLRELFSIPFNLLKYGLYRLKK